MVSCSSEIQQARSHMINQPPNQAASGNGAITPLCHAGRAPRAVPKQQRSAPRTRTVGREDFSFLFFLCDLSGRGVIRFFPHAEDAKVRKGWSRSAVAKPAITAGSSEL